MPGAGTEVGGHASTGIPFTFAATQQAPRRAGSGRRCRNNGLCTVRDGRHAFVADDRHLFGAQWFVRRRTVRLKRVLRRSELWVVAQYSGTGRRPHGPESVPPSASDRAGAARNRNGAGTVGRAPAPLPETTKPGVSRASCRIRTRPPRGRRWLASGLETAGGVAAGSGAAERSKTPCRRHTRTLQNALDGALQSTARTAGSSCRCSRCRRSRHRAPAAARCRWRSSPTHSP